MENSQFDFHAAETLLRARREPLIKSGTQLDQAFFAWCGASEFGLVEIMALFPKSTSKDRAIYDCEIKCPTCKTRRIESLGRSAVQKLIGAAKSNWTNLHPWEFECESCTIARKEERERSYDPDHLQKWMRQRETEELQKARERTPAFIENYLSPRKVWNRDTSERQRFQSLTRERLDDEAVAAAIRAMPEDEFLRTPYWTAVKPEILRRAGGKCSICGSGGQLTLHYRTPERRGYEHTEEGLREILCLCERCKNTHLLKTPQTRN